MRAMVAHINRVADDEAVDERSFLLPNAVSARDRSSAQNQASKAQAYTRLIA